MGSMLKSVLIANRGEIACRIARSATGLGMRVIAVYSDADADALHVRMADEAYCIGPPPPAQSYLDIQKVIAVAVQSSAQCIHPGYGFLSENAQFAEACTEAGIVFVGPPAAAIKAMGLKNSAKDLMESAGVPIVPGYQGSNQDAAHLAAMADETGYPVLIKAVAGGGGRGMRRVDGPAQFADALASCRREAKASFDDDRVLIEKFVSSPRHIEVQVFADGHGNCVHMFERDCSMQRRHQKVIEEAPAPGMPQDMRAQMCAAAINAATAVGYEGAGTVEFIADCAQGLRADRFYFMEMNTRLQVEHPVSEAITGIDLVDLQFRIAGGEALPFTQDDIVLNGHAIEARIYAEDPNSGYLPQSGKLHVLKWPDPRDDLRIDTGVEEGAEVSPYYDPMIAKVIFHGKTREAAIAGLGKALADCTVLGVRSNLEFNRRLVGVPAFVAGKFDTGFIDQHAEQLCDAELPGAAVLAGVDCWLQSMWQHSDHTITSPWELLAGWSLGGLPRRDWLHLTINAMDVRARIDWANGERHYTVEMGAREIIGVVSRGEVQGGQFICKIDGQLVEAAVWSNMLSGKLIISALGVHCDIAAQDLLNQNEETAAGSADLKAPMSGRIIQLIAEPGQTVIKGQKLAVLEAMKMEHNLTAGFDGTVQTVSAKEGDQVTEGQVLLVLAAVGQEIEAVE